MSEQRKPWEEPITYSPPEVPKIIEHDDGEAAEHEDVRDGLHANHVKSRLDPEELEEDPAHFKIKKPGQPVSTGFTRSEPELPQAGFNEEPINYSRRGDRNQEWGVDPDDE